MNTTIADLVLNGTSTRQVATVQETRNYARFSLMELNRDVNRQHVERLKKSFERDYLLTPILVNENFEIVDGQHRFAAAKEMGLPIRYVVANGYTIEHVKMLNHEGKNWSTIDHFMSYVKAEVPAYVETSKLFAKYEGVRASTILSIVYKFSIGSSATGAAVYRNGSRIKASANTQGTFASENLTASIKNGSFNASGLAKADEFLQWLFNRAKHTKLVLSLAYTYALLDFVFYNKEYDQDRMAHAIDNYHVIMSNVPNKALAERELENVYNYKRHSRVRLARV